MGAAQKQFMEEAIRLSLVEMRKGNGGPFGAVVVKDGKIVGRGCNLVSSTNDPTAHAEVVAIRDACKNLNTYQLSGCEIYTSCEPCPMCLGAIYWARPAKVYFGCTKENAASHGFDDHFIYQEMDKPADTRHIPFVQLMKDEAELAFLEWDKLEGKKLY